MRDRGLIKTAPETGRNALPKIRTKKGNEGVLRMNFRYFAAAKTMVDQKSLAV